MNISRGVPWRPQLPLDPTRGTGGQGVPLSHRREHVEAALLPA